MAAIPFKFQFDFEYGQLQQITPNIRRIIAKNPSAFTFRGTGTYVIGKGNVAVIDPGPLMPEHVDALVAGLAGETVTHILITHTHMDHSPAAAPLKAKTGARTYGYGPHGAGKAEEGIQVEEGGDMAFVPDVVVRDGDVIEGDGWTVEAVYTPGHTSNHLCFAFPEEQALFTGDHVMGWSTSIIAPPDGDMTAYMASLDKLLARDDKVYWPTHGTSIDNPHEFVRAFVEHRLERERQIIKCLGDGVVTIEAMVPLMYTELDKNMYGAAARSVHSAMLRLIDLGTVGCTTEPGAGATYSLR